MSSCTRRSLLTGKGSRRSAAASRPAGQLGIGARAPSARRNRRAPGVAALLLEIGAHPLHQQVEGLLAAAQPVQRLHPAPAAPRRAGRRAPPDRACGERHHLVEMLAGEQGLEGFAEQPPLARRRLAAAFGELAAQAFGAAAQRRVAPVEPRLARQRGCRTAPGRSRRGSRAGRRPPRNKASGRPGRAPRPAAPATPGDRRPGRGLRRGRLAQPARSLRAPEPLRSGRPRAGRRSARRGGAARTGSPAPSLRRRWRAAFDGVGQRLQPQRLGPAGRRRCSCAVSSLACFSKPSW